MADDRRTAAGQTPIHPRQRNDQIARTGIDFRYVLKQWIDILANQTLAAARARHSGGDFLQRFYGADDQFDLLRYTIACKTQRHKQADAGSDGGDLHAADQIVARPDALSGRLGQRWLAQQFFRDQCIHEIHIVATAFAADAIGFDRAGEVHTPEQIATLPRGGAEHGFQPLRQRVAQIAEMTGKQEEAVDIGDRFVQRRNIDLDFAHARADPVERGLCPGRRLKGLILRDGGVPDHPAATHAVLTLPERGESGNVVALRHHHISGQHEFDVGLQQADLSIDVFRKRRTLRLLRIAQCARRHAQHDAVERSLRPQHVELFKTLVPLLSRLATLFCGGQLAFAIDQYTVTKIRPVHAFGLQLIGMLRRVMPPCGRHRCDQAALAGALLAKHQQPGLLVAPFAARGKVIDGIEKTFDPCPQPRADSALPIRAANIEDRRFAKTTHDHGKHHQSNQNTDQSERCFEKIDIAKIDFAQIDLVETGLGQ